MEIDQGSESKCSVCACTLVLENETRERSSSRRMREKLPPPLSILQNQLETVFFMRNVLELPVKKLVTYLKTKGDPENWIKFCQSCVIKIKNVRKLFTELQTVSRKYEEAKSEILVKIGSLKKENFNAGIPTECRGWIVRNGLNKRKSSKIVSNDSFADGDKKALKLVSRLKSERRPTSKNQRVFKLEETENLPFLLDDSVKVEADEGLSMIIDAQDEDMISNGETTSVMNEHGFSESDDDESESSTAKPDSDSDEEWEPEIPKVKPVQERVEESSEAVPVKKRIRLDETSVDHKVYSCSLCNDKINLNICEFTQHIYEVHQTQYKCAVCPRDFPVRDYWKIQTHWCKLHKEELKEFLHEERVVKVDPLLPDLDWPCPACPCTAFTSEDLRDAHLITCDDGRNVDKPFTCESCSKTYVNKEELELHIVIVHPGMFKETPFRCNICLDFFSTETKLRKHKIMSHAVDKFMCEICGKNFRDTTVLKSHMQEWHDKETGLEKVTCKFCQKTFTRGDTLTKHILVVHEQLKEPCIVCGENVGIGNVGGHLRWHHGIRTGTRMKYYYCVFRGCNCGKAFPDLESIKEHVESKRLEASLTPKPPIEKYTCDVCGVSRRTNYAVDIHKAIVHQIGVEKFSCKDCGKFVRKGPRSTEHVCGVEEQKSHVCDHCGFATMHKKTLQCHVKSVHEKSFDFLCELCSFGTNQRTALGNHKASVHGIGDYPCKMEGCTRVYGNLDRMEKHYGSVHEGRKMPKTHVCSLCKARFSCGSNLKRHVLTVHSNK